MVAELRRFCQEHIDAAAIDRDAEIPQSVIDGLGKLGVLGACVPQEFGGGGFSQTSYCRMIEVLGRTLRQHGAVRQRPSFDRPAGAGAVRHARAAGALAAEDGHAASGSAPLP